MSKTWPKKKLYYADSSSVNCGSWLRYDWCILHEAWVTQTLDSHPELQIPSASKLRAFRGDDNVSMHVSNAFVLPAARPTPMRWSDNDVATMTGFPFRHYAFVFDYGKQVKRAQHSLWNVLHRLILYELHDASYSQAKP